MKLTFLGAAETVTGSKYLLESNGKKILVDCGLFQGRKELRLRNWRTLPMNAADIESVILSHAHIDHSGYFPLLVKNGFSGTAYCTHATKDLCEILLPDSGYLQEELASHANKYGFSKHKPALPLYTEEEARASLKHLATVDYGKLYHLFGETSFQFNRAGHILGAASVWLKFDGLSLLFSGDLGNENDPIMRPPVAVQPADYLILESTYGDRLHEGPEPIDELEQIINRTVKRGGTILIPAFAVGRTQIILYYIYQLKLQHKIPDIPLYLDSPMAIDATEIFSKYSHEHKLTAAETAAVCREVKYVNTVEESKLIDTYEGPKIIISASGMATGGRVLHHMRVFAGDARNTFLFTGYQAESTRGDLLVNQHHRDIKLLGNMVHIEAEIAALSNISAHADYNELLHWLKDIKTPPRKVFITHGERGAAYALKEKIEENFSWNCVVPAYLQQEELQ